MKTSFGHNVIRRDPRITPKVGAEPLAWMFVPHLGGTGRRLELIPDGSRIYMKDGTHRESIVRVPKAADERILALCDQVPGLSEDDLSSLFKSALLTGKVPAQPEELQSEYTAVPATQTVTTHSTHATSRSDASSAPAGSGSPPAPSLSSLDGTIRCPTLHSDAAEARLRVAHDARFERVP